MVCVIYVRKDIPYLIRLLHAKLPQSSIATLCILMNVLNVMKATYSTQMDNVLAPNYFAMLKVVRNVNNLLQQFASVVQQDTF